MSATSEIPSMPNVAFLGLLIFLCLYPGVGTTEVIVDTDPHVVLQVGTKGILPCRIQSRGYSVDWKRQLSSGSELLVSLDLLFDVGARDGPGYEAGLINITEEYSLMIKDVEVQDEGLYICAFTDYQTGKVFINSTRVSAQALPTEPFPTIEECIGKDESPGACTLTVNSTSNLTCLVERYYPDIDLFFLHGSENVTATAYEEWNNTDGTKNMEIRVQISVSDEPYECVASGLPGIAGNRSVSVIVQARSQDHSQGPRPAAITVSVLLIVLVCLSIAVFLYRRRTGRGFCGASLRYMDPETGDVIMGILHNELSILSRNVPSGEYYYISCSLKLKYSRADDILSKHNGDITKALRECVAVWKNMTGGSWTQLREILHRHDHFGAADENGGSETQLEEIRHEHDHGGGSIEASSGYTDRLYESDLEIEQKLMEVAVHMPACKYTTLCSSLGIGYNQAMTALTTRANDYQTAVRCCLAEWKNRTDGSLDDLKGILIKAELGSLLKYVR